MRPLPHTIIAASLLFAAGDARAALGQSTREVVASVTVAAAPERVVRAFSHPEDLAGWWKVTRSASPSQVGDGWAVAWDDYGEEKTAHIWTGVVRAMEPRRLLVEDMVLVEPNRPLFTGLALEVTAVESADGSGSVVTVRHKGYRLDGADWEWAYEIVDAGWKHVLGDLQVWFEAQSR